MTQQEREQCFDFPIPNEKVERLAKEIIANGWKLDESKWMKTETVSFYKGMFSMVRIIHSTVKDQETLDLFTKIGLDCLFMIHKLNEMAKFYGKSNINTK